MFCKGYAAPFSMKLAAKCQNGAAGPSNGKIKVPPYFDRRAILLYDFCMECICFKDVSFAYPVAEDETDADGKYSFSVESGIYNVVSEYNGVTKTELVEITTSQDFDLTMPEKNTNSVLNISEGTPDIMVGGLDVEAETVRAAQNGEPGAVTVTMTVNKKEESAEIGRASCRERV